MAIWPFVIEFKGSQPEKVKRGPKGLWAWGQSDLFAGQGTLHLLQVFMCGIGAKAAASRGAYEADGKSIGLNVVLPKE